MVVPIGNITLTLTNSNVTYVAIGMNVNVTAYGANSKLMNVTANIANSEVSLGMQGTLKFKTNTTSNTLFTIYNDNSLVLTQNNDKFLTNVNTVFTETLYTKSYAEGAKFVATTNTSVTLDLNDATAFFVKANTGSKILDNLSIIKPSSFTSNRNRSLSCAITVVDGADVRDSFWTSAGVVWPNGLAPAKPNGANPKLYSLMYSPNFPYNWFGFSNSGIGGKYLVIANDFFRYETSGGSINIRNFLVDKGVSASSVDFKTYSQSLSNISDYSMVFDIEFENVIPGNVADAYYNYMTNNAGKLYLQSEHVYFNTRNISVINFVKRCGESSSLATLSMQQSGFFSLGYALSYYYLNWNRGTNRDGTYSILAATNGIHPEFKGGAKPLVTSTTRSQDYNGSYSQWLSAYNQVLYQSGNNPLINQPIMSGAYWDNSSLNVVPNGKIATVFDVNFLDDYRFISPTGSGGGVFTGPENEGRNLFNTIFELFLE